MAEQLFYGRISGVTPQGNSSNSYIRLRGDFVSGTNTMTNIVDQSGFLPLEFVRAGQMLRASGPYTFGVTISDVDVSGRTITLETNASATRTNSLARIAPGAGEYFIESASLQDPQQLVDYSDITGSDDSEYSSVSSSRYAVLGQAFRSSKVNGRFHLYEIVNVHGRNGSNGTANLYVRFAESGSEADTGDVFDSTANQNLAIVELSSNNGLAPIFKSGLAANFDLTNGEEFAAYQLALSDFLDNLQTGSGDSSESASFATTASYAHTASLLLGSIESASFATTASHALNASAESSSYATTASYALNALTASYALSSSHEIVTEVTSSFATTASFAFAAETLLGTVDTASNADTASILENTLKFGDGLGGTEFNGRIDVTASIDTGSSHFQTGSKTAIESFPDLGITGSILGTASYAVTASYALNVIADTQADLTALNTFTSSIQSEVDALQAVTGGYAITSSISGAYDSVSSSFATDLTTAIANVSGEFSGGADVDVNTTNLQERLSELTGNVIFSTASRVIIGANTSTERLHIHNTAGNAASKIQLTNGDTGTGSASGFKVGINGTEAAMLWNYENTPMYFSTNNTTQFGIYGSGKAFFMEPLSVGSLNTASNALDVTGVVSASSYLGDGSQLTGITATTDTGSLLTTASISDVTMSFTKGDATTFDLILDSSSFALTASHALNATAESASYATTASHALTASLLLGSIESASYAETASYVDIASTERYNFSSTSSFTFTHGLNSDDVLVQAYEVNGGTHLQSIPEDIEILSDSQIKVSFAVVTSGYVVVGRGGFLRGGIQDSASFATTSSHALTASYALNAGGGSGEGFPYTGSAFVTGSLNVTGSVNILSGSLVIDSGSITADEFVVGEAAVGNPVVSASATLTLHAGNAVAIDNAPFRLAQFTDAQTGSIVAQDGDMIWNTDRGQFMGYSGSAWFEFTLT